MDWYSDSQYIKDEVKTLTESEAAYALREAWYNIYKAYPSHKSLALLWAQSCLETGRWKSIHCYNFGNMKKIHANDVKNIKDDGHYFTMFRCNELINNRLEWFNPPHIQTHFRAYKTIIDGAEDYIKFVSQRARYKKAWQAVLDGDPYKYSRELKLAGYYTASESLYTAGVVRLTKEFLEKVNKLLSDPPPKGPDTLSPTVSTLPPTKSTTVTEILPPKSNNNSTVIIPPSAKVPDFSNKSSSSEEDPVDFKPKVNIKHAGVLGLIVIIITVLVELLSK